MFVLYFYFRKHYFTLKLQENVKDENKHKMNLKTFYLFIKTANTDVF